MNKNKPLPLEEIKKLHRSPVNANIKLKESLTPLERGAVWVTNHVGTIEFFIICNVMVAMTLIFPKTVITIQFISSAWLQLVLLPLIMIGQNIQNRHSEIRAEANFEVNKKAELETETILQYLENQNETINEILKKLESK
jgi:uncharacterized membrane protein